MSDGEDGNFFSHRPGFEEVDGSTVIEIPRFEEFGLRNVGCDFERGLERRGRYNQRVI